MVIEWSSELLSTKVKLFLNKGSFRHVFPNLVYFLQLVSCLDPDLQDAFKDYLVDRGVNAELTNFLLLHLRQKEQDQYVNWLHGLENFLKSGV